jgi:hypothetical protein
LVVLPVRYTNIPFFLEGKERERQKERGENIIQCLKNTALLFYFNLLMPLARPMERERESSSSSILWVPRMDAKFQIGG